MKIDRITLTHVRVPLVEPFRISSGEVSEKDAIVVAVYSEGAVGYGEASPMAGAFYSEDTPESTWECLTHELLPRVLRAKPESIERLNLLLEEVPGNAFAKAGLETAFWDLEAQCRGEPLYRTLGGTRSTVHSGLAVGIYPTVSKLLKEIERHLADGYVRVKIKIRPGWDIEPLLAVRGEFGRIPLMVDANCAYTRSDIGHLQALDDFELMMVEQPLPRADLEGHAELQAALRTPVCLDESAEDLPTIHRAIALKSCRIVNIKIQRVGGLQTAREIHDACAAEGIPVWAGTMPELGIGGGQSVHLAALEHCSFPTDVEASRRWFVDEIVDPWIEVEKGKIRIPSGTGNCYRPNLSTINRYKLRSEEFKERLL